jgi:hypothetical protein
MTRELTSHRVNPANDKLVVEVLDEPGSGGAHHCYSITGFDYARNQSVPDRRQYGDLKDEDTAIVLFQNGPIAEAGVNGLTHEVLLAILIDRLECFQAGAFANPYNQTALQSLRVAQEALLARTRHRMARGVEGTHTA